MRIAFVSIAVFGVFLVAGIAPRSTLAVTCPNPGERPAIASDAAVKNRQISIGTCYDPKNALAINQVVEEAKRFLSDRYSSPGFCSQKGLANPKVDGIAKLDAEFAINLANMLKAAPVYISINSAFRTQEAQQCANPKVKNSYHSKGCAVDLGYNQKHCNSDACKWVRANAANFKLQLRLPFSPEWNHIEPIKCSGTSIGPPVPGG
ncbi:MAG: M15 family metallopeptidase, partial [bacterium]|nr:M15 family metallopeptidase [bacterium]